MLKDIVNNRYDHASKSKRLKVILCMNAALMFLSTPVTSGLASCPSVHTYRRKYYLLSGTRRFSKASISLT
ncbi:hypothetical protein BGW80DRAFT_1290601 [Lactifluus volemus]|nr:hypothetical protein BGW80DRAFT_1290601 [Lactifluus volemus]